MNDAGVDTVGWFDNWFVAVSYTHLDVYKRQALANTVLERPCTSMPL